MSLLRTCRSLILVAVAAALAQGAACRKADEPPTIERVTAGEPDHYAATVVRTVEDATGRQVFTSRVARSGEMFREEWSERGRRLILIFRPDLGKSFLLFPDDRTYIESNAEPGALGAAHARAEAEESLAEDSRARATAPDHTDPNHIDPDHIDRVIGHLPSPSRVETRSLPDQTIEGHVCEVTEERATSEDGREEVTRMFRARELAGLAVRVEVEGVGVRIITERRDIEIAPQIDEFAVPKDFRRVPPRSGR